MARSSDPMACSALLPLFFRMREGGSPGDSLTWETTVHN
jgi:hypothetical protein